MDGIVQRKHGFCNDTKSSPELMDWVARPTNTSSYRLEAKYGASDAAVLSAYEPGQVFGVFVQVRASVTVGVGRVQ